MEREEAQKVMLEELHISRERGIEASFRGEPVLAIAGLLAETFLAEEAENYFVLEFNHEKIGPFTLTVQRTRGKQPHHVAAELRAEVQRLTDELATLRTAATPPPEAGNG